MVKDQLDDGQKTVSAEYPKDELIAELRDDLTHASDELRETVKDLADARRRLAKVTQELDSVRHERNLANEELHNMRVSVFWRATAPARNFFTKHPGAAIKLRKFARGVYRTLTGRIFKDLKNRSLVQDDAPVPVAKREVKSGGVQDRLSPEKAQRLLNESLHPPLRAIVSATEYSPKISLLVPTYNTPSRYLLELIQSVQAQTYENWQLCIADDGSKEESTKEIIRKAASDESRIRFVLCEKNQGIGKASMEAAKLADGDYVSMLDHDDALAPGALSTVVDAIRGNREVDMFYTDHAMMSKSGELVSVALKPDWSPEFFLNTNYVVHFKTVRKSLFDKIGGFEGTHDLYTDGGLILKLMRAGAKIEHIPRIEYYWRMHESSVSDSSSRKPGIIKAATDSVDRYLEWKGVKAHATWAPRLRQTGFGLYKLQFPDKPIEKVAIVVLVWPGSRFEESFVGTLEESRWPGTSVHFVGVLGATPRPPVPNARVITVNSQAELDAQLRAIECDAMVFVPSCAIFSSHDWLKELTGYLSVSPEIGVVGGKSLDQFLHTESGAVRLINGLPTLSGGMVDTHHGYWFENTIACDVEAVSLRLLASRKSVLNEIGAPPVFEYDEDAGIGYCLKARAKGLRTVFNPWAKIVVSRGRRQTKDTERKLVAEFGPLHDRYYHSEFDSGSA